MAQDPRHRSISAGPAEPALDPAGPRRDTVGRILRRGRERDRLNLRNVADALRIRYDYLDAIERSDFDRLPGATYAIGFVRSYASYLELDDEEIVRQFKQEIHGLNRTQDLNFPEPVNEGKVPGKALLIVSFVLVGAAYGGWHYLSQSPDRQISDMVPAVPDRLKAFLDEGDTASPVESGDGATVTEFADRDTADGAAAGTASTDPESPRTDGAPTDGAPTEGAPTGSAAASDGDDTAASDGTRDSTAETASGATGAGSGAAASSPAGSDGSAADTLPDAPATADAGTGAATSEGGETAEGGEPADGGATQTASIPDAPDPAAPDAAATSGDRAQPAADDGAATDSATSGRSGGDDGAGTAANGIPEPPSPGGDTSPLPDAPVNGANAAATDVNGAQREVLSRAKRVFGAENGSSRMLLRATQDSWVQVRGADDTLLLTRVLNPGDVYRVPDREGLVLHTGNAGGLEVYVDGDPAGNLGETGEVRRNVTLSPDALQ